MEQDLFPSRRSQDESRDLSEREEERRLFYVALTRAAKKVFLTYASFRTIFGTRQINAPSEFLSDIDNSRVRFESHTGETTREKPSRSGKVSLLGWDEENDDVVYI
jgi:DNA helicase-2/ATP-dependent DNA helicase PcrA